MSYHWPTYQTYLLMAIKAYQFKEDSGQLVEQADGQYKTHFELAAYDGQTFQYVDKGVNADNFREVDVNIMRDEKDPLSYHAAETPTYSLDGLDGVQLVSKKDGLKRGGLSIVHG